MDSTSARAHQHAAGVAKGGTQPGTKRTDPKRSGAPAADRLPGFTCWPTSTAAPWPCLPALASAATPRCSNPDGRAAVAAHYRGRQGLLLGGDSRPPVPPRDHRHHRPARRPAGRPQTQRSGRWQATGLRPPGLPRTHHRRAGRQPAQAEPGGSDQIRHDSRDRRRNRSRRHPPRLRDLTHPKEHALSRSGRSGPGAQRRHRPRRPWRAAPLAVAGRAGTFKTGRPGGRTVAA